MWPKQLYTAEQSRLLDRLAIASGITGYELMCRAGLAAFKLLLNRLEPINPHQQQSQHLHILCGCGNNGGDGFVVARLAHEHGIPYSVYLLGDQSKIRNEAKQALDDAVTAGVQILPITACITIESGVIVDALLGTGLTGELRHEFQQAIQLINDSNCPVLALDVPSGLCSDTGQILGIAVKAEQTISFITAKRGLYSGRGAEFSGERFFDDLAVPQHIYAECQDAIEHSDLAELLRYIPPRPRDAHKGLYGHVLIVGGNYGMAGAAMMAAESAARVGAGLVSVATQPEHIPAILARHPEIMVHGVVSGQELDPVLQKPTVIVLGPGLGQSPWSEQMVQKVLNTNLPVIVDADALNIISQGRVLTNKEGNISRENWVLTPHPGEAARLLEVSIAELQADRFTAVKTLQEKFGGSIVLKGAGSLINSGGTTSLCSYGNPGMATGGMGDVLSGLIGGLLAQGMAGHQATQLAVTLHAKAADLAAEASGIRGLLATDLIPYMRRLLNNK